MGAPLLSYMHSHSLKIPLFVYSEPICGELGSCTLLKAFWYTIMPHNFLF